jgi:EpsI family protein
LEPDIEKALGADDYLIASYKSEAAPVSVLVVYFASQAQGNSIHSPAVCLPGSGWEVSGWREVDTGLLNSSGQPLHVNRAIIQKGSARQLVYYWFEQRGRSVTNDYLAKAYTAWDLVSQGRTDGALVRVITPIGPEGDQAADNRMKGFLKEILPALPKFVPS